jgi:hypothetical protein
MNALLGPARSCANGLGLAWWARVETRSPDVTYWFGPYLRRRTLETQLPPFLSDINAEGVASLDYRDVRSRRQEPLTEPG